MALAAVALHGRVRAAQEKKDGIRLRLRDLVGAMDRKTVDDAGGQRRLLAEAFQLEVVAHHKGLPAALSAADEVFDKAPCAARAILVLRVQEKVLEAELDVSHPSSLTNDAALELRRWVARTRELSEAGCPFCTGQRAPREPTPEMRGRRRSQVLSSICSSHMDLLEATRRAVDEEVVTRRWDSRCAHFLRFGTRFDVRRSAGKVFRGGLLDWHSLRSELEVEPDVLESLGALGVHSTSLELFPELRRFCAGKSSPLRSLALALSSSGLLEVAESRLKPLPPFTPPPPWISRYLEAPDVEDLIVEEDGRRTGGDDVELGEEVEAVEVQVADGPWQRRLRLDKQFNEVHPIQLRDLGFGEYLDALARAGYVMWEEGEFLPPPDVWPPPCTFDGRVSMVRRKRTVIRPPRDLGDAAEGAGDAGRPGSSGRRRRRSSLGRRLSHSGRYRINRRSIVARLERQRGEQENGEGRQRRLRRKMVRGDETGPEAEELEEGEGEGGGDGGEGEGEGHAEGGDGPERVEGGERREGEAPEAQAAGVQQLLELPDELRPHAPAATRFRPAPPSPTASTTHLSSPVPQSPSDVQSGEHQLGARTVEEVRHAYLSRLALEGATERAMNRERKERRRKERAERRARREARRAARRERREGRDAESGRRGGGAPAVGLIRRRAGGEHGAPPSTPSHPGGPTLAALISGASTLSEGEDHPTRRSAASRRGANRAGSPPPSSFSSSLSASSTASTASVVGEGTRRSTQWEKTREVAQGPQQVADAAVHPPLLRPSEVLQQAFEQREAGDSLLEAWTGGSAASPPHSPPLPSRPHPPSPPSPPPLHETRRVRHYRDAFEGRRPDAAIVELSRPRRRSMSNHPQSPIVQHRRRLSLLQGEQEARAAELAVRPKTPFGWIGAALGALRWCARAKKKGRGGWTVAVGEEGEEGGEGGQSPPQLLRARTLRAESSFANLMERMGERARVSLRGTGAPDSTRSSWRASRRREELGLESNDRQLERAEAAAAEIALRFRGMMWVRQHAPKEWAFHLALPKVVEDGGEGGDVETVQREDGSVVLFSGARSSLPSLPSDDETSSSGERSEGEEEEECGVTARFVGCDSREFCLLPRPPPKADRPVSANRLVLQSPLRRSKPADGVRQRVSIVALRGARLDVAEELSDEEVGERSGRDSRRASHAVSRFLAEPKLVGPWDAFGVPAPVSLTAVLATNPAAASQLEEVQGLIQRREDALRSLRELLLLLPTSLESLRELLPLWEAVSVLIGSNGANDNSEASSPPPLSLLEPWLRRLRVIPEPQQVSLVHAFYRLMQVSIPTWVAAIKAEKSLSIPVRRRWAADKGLAWSSTASIRVHLELGAEAYTDKMRHDVADAFFWAEVYRLLEQQRKERREGRGRERDDGGRGSMPQFVTPPPSPMRAHSPPHGPPSPPPSRPAAAQQGEEEMPRGTSSRVARIVRSPSPWSSDDEVAHPPLPSPPPPPPPASSAVPRLWVPDRSPLAPRRPRTSRPVSARSRYDATLRARVRPQSARAALEDEKDAFSSRPVAPRALHLGVRRGEGEREEESLLPAVTLGSRSVLEIAKRGMVRSTGDGAKHRSAPPRPSTASTVRSGARRQHPSDIPDTDQFRKASTAHLAAALLQRLEERRKGRRREGGALDAPPRPPAKTRSLRRAMRPQFANGRVVRPDTASQYLRRRGALPNVRPVMFVRRERDEHEE